MKLIKRKVLSEKFFGVRANIVAPQILGKFLVRYYRGKEISAEITEVEAYDGFSDRGSHASRGKTARNTPMFDSAGRAYIYFTYGMHWMLNVVTGKSGYPSAILIRGVHGIKGPARVTKHFHIDKKFNNKMLSKKNMLWIEDRGVKISASKIKKGPRIGIDYAGPYWSKRHWRFWIY